MSLDKALEFGAGFDWITPTLALFKQATGSHVYFAVPADRLAEVVVILRGAGIKIHDRQTFRGHFMFSVKAAHAKQAEQLLTNLQ